MLSYLLKVTCEWNVPDAIIQMIASILGAFLGFIFAIKVSELDNRKQTNEHIKNLFSELVAFYSDENIKKLKESVTNVEDIKIINLPFLERTVALNIGYKMLGIAAFKKCKELNLAIEQINYIFTKKNDYYYDYALELAAICRSKLDFNKQIEELITDNTKENKYIAYNKTIYEKINGLFEKFPQDDVLNELKNNKKTEKIIKRISNN